MGIDTNHCHGDLQVPACMVRLVAVSRTRWVAIDKISTALCVWKAKVSEERCEHIVVMREEWKQVPAWDEASCFSDGRVVQERRRSARRQRWLPKLDTSHERCQRLFQSGPLPRA